MNGRNGRMGGGGRERPEEDRLFIERETQKRAVKTGIEEKLKALSLNMAGAPAGKAMAKVIFARRRTLVGN